MGPPNRSPACDLTSWITGSGPDQVCCHSPGLDPVTLIYASAMGFSVPRPVLAHVGCSSLDPHLTDADYGIRPDGNPNFPEPTLLQKMGEAAATTLASIFVLAVGFGLAGYAYHKFYKRLVLVKMENAFAPGDPVLDLAATAKDVPRDDDDRDGRWVRREEQDLIDRIISGELAGHYYLLIGDKGTGKSSMIIEAMRRINGEGVSMFEAHADLEIVRIRLGKSLDYEFHEDYIGGYFSERGPRDSTALLDIERALNKLEKVALKNRRERGRPLVLIINQMHLIRDDDDGKDVIELLQQRAEQWAAANLVTMVFNSDDYWVYERLKQLATRMEVIPVLDLPKKQALAALQRYRGKYFHEDVPNSLLEEVYNRVGGRLSFLNRVAKSRDMLETCEKIKEVEKKWFLNQCWILGSEMDDDVMDQQKWAVRFRTQTPPFSFFLLPPSFPSVGLLTHLRRPPWSSRSASLTRRRRWSTPTTRRQATSCPACRSTRRRSS